MTILMRLVSLSLWGAVGFAAVLLLMGARSERVCSPLSTLSSREPLSFSACFSGWFFSQSLQENVSFNLILPKGFNLNRGAYPYAVSLHGRGGSRDQLLELGVLSSMDDLVDKGDQPFLIIAPSGGDRYWMNTARSEKKLGDAIARDLVEFVESNLPVNKGRPESRALFGISMGGHGVVQLGFSYSGQFAIGLSVSPVFRREVDIAPGSGDEEAFGSGAEYRKRSPRHLCEGVGAAGAACLPFEKFRLGIDANDVNLNQYPDTRTLISELAERHRDSRMQISFEACESNPGAQGHTHAYWTCLMPSYLQWLSAAFGK